MQFFADIYGHERFYRAAQELHRAVKVLKGYKEPQRVAQGRLEISFAAQDPTGFYTAVHAQGRSGSSKASVAPSAQFWPGGINQICVIKGVAVRSTPNLSDFAISMEMCLSHSENQCFFFIFQKF